MTSATSVGRRVMILACASIAAAASCTSSDPSGSRTGDDTEYQFPLLGTWVPDPGMSFEATMEKARALSSAAGDTSQSKSAEEMIRNMTNVSGKQLHATFKANNDFELFMQLGQDQAPKVFTGRWTWARYGFLCKSASGQESLNFDGYKDKYLQFNPSGSLVYILKKRKD